MAPKKRRKLGLGGAGQEAAPDTADVPEPQPLPFREEWSEPATRSSLRQQFQEAQPFRHVMLRPFLGEEGLKAVRSELESLSAKEKETDLFRFFQTGDLAPLAGGSAVEATKASPAGRGRAAAKRRGKQKAALHMPSVQRTPKLAALARSFASESYRELCQDITQCGELSDRLDLSAQIYPKGSHLLCHDDVIGTRKISFIYYLTDPTSDWESSEGGALELYAQQPGAPAGTPSTDPAKEMLPLSDALVMFVVEPGVSFHAVREVRGDRARVSIQGWLHAPTMDLTCGFANRDAATLNQLLQGKKANAGGLGEGVAAQGENGDQAAWSLTPEDKALLSEWLAPEYLDPAQLEAVAERFADASYAVLAGFLRSDVFEGISRAHAAADAADSFGAQADEPSVPPYGAGVAEGWKSVGPPHLRRYLRFEETPNGEESNGLHRALGAALRRPADELLRSDAFRRWLHACTRLEPRDSGTAEVRRFRPGMDYTVAVCPPQAQGDCGAELDATLVVVGGGAAGSSASSSSRPAAAAGGAAAWDDEEVGGFESYLAADEDEETVQAQEVYRGSDEGPLVNLPPVANSLCLVMRDPGTLRFVKFLSRDALSSRADVAACFPVDLPPESDEDGEEDAAAQ